MEIVNYVFIDSNEDKDLKRKYGYDVDCDAIVTRSDCSKNYYFRKDVVAYIMNCFRNRTLIYGKKKTGDKLVEYSFTIQIEENVKGCVVIEIPTYLLMIDSNARTIINILDKYVGRATDLRRKERLLCALAIAGGTALTLGIFCSVVEGFIREIELNEERDKQYYEDYIRHNREFSSVSNQFDKDDAHECYVSSTISIADVDDNSKVLDKTR